jgi:glycosyltransferase involved in cell wall biosynthesis
MRIGIDVRYLSHGLVGGVHTYVAHFVPALLDLAGDHEVVLYADTKRPLELRPASPRVAVRYLPWRNPLSSVRNDLFAWRAMRRDGLDVVHFPANYGFGPPGIPVVLTVHDAINLLPLPEIWRGHARRPRTVAMMTYLHACTRAAVRRAACVLTVSAYARDEIARYGGLPPRRVLAVPHGRAPDLERIDDPAILEGVRRRHGLARSFILADALKNPQTAVAAWELLPETLRRRTDLVFFCRRPDPPPPVSAAVAAGHARLLVRPPRADLVALYSMAEAFVFPSWIEGFGLPVLEAMTCGAPVVASDRGAIPEVAGGAALLADAEDARAFAGHLAAVLASPDAAQELRRRGRARAAGFTWSRTAGRILESYERAAREASAA